MTKSWYTAHRDMFKEVQRAVAGTFPSGVKENVNAYSNWLPPQEGVFAFFSGGGGDHSHLSTGKSEARAFQCNCQIVGRFSMKEEQRAMEFATSIQRQSTIMASNTGNVNRLILSQHADINPEEIKRPNTKANLMVWRVSLQYLMLYSTD